MTSLNEAEQPGGLRVFIASCAAKLRNWHPHAESRGRGEILNLPSLWRIFASFLYEQKGRPPAGLTGIRQLPGSHSMLFLGKCRLFMELSFSLHPLAFPNFNI